MPMHRSSLTLCWVGLVFSSLVGADVRQQREVDEQRPIAPELAMHLAHRFEERLALDVADRAADLGDDHLGVGLLRRPARCAP